MDENKTLLTLSVCPPVIIKLNCDKYALGCCILMFNNRWRRHWRSVMLWKSRAHLRQRTAAPLFKILHVAAGGRLRAAGVGITVNHAFFFVLLLRFSACCWTLSCRLHSSRCFSSERRYLLQHGSWAWWAIARHGGRVTGGAARAAVFVIVTADRLLCKKTKVQSVTDSQVQIQTEAWQCLAEQCWQK